jgi:hypothetical protein
MPGWELVYEPKVKKPNAPIITEIDGNESDCEDKPATNSKCVIDLSLFVEE